MIDEIFAKFDGAFAENTLRAYRSDFKGFKKWCELNNVEALKPTPEDISNYIEELSTKLKTSTISRKITCIQTIPTLSGHANPTRAPEVILALKRLYRQKGKYQEQATPLTREVLEKLIKVSGKGRVGRRNKILLYLGYETMRRRTEICNFEFNDLIAIPNGKRAIRLKFSKMDQYGSGKVIPISNLLYDLIIRWQRQVGDEGKILRNIYKSGRIGERLNPASIKVILPDLQHFARLKFDKPLSGHSFRVGAALDMLENSEPLEKIMLRGG